MRKISETQSIPEAGITASVGTTYDSDGNAASLTFPDGRVLNYTYRPIPVEARHWSLERKKHASQKGQAVFDFRAKSLLNLAWVVRPRFRPGRHRRAVGAPVVWWLFTWAFDPGYADPSLWPSNLPFTAGAKMTGKGKGDMERGRRAIFDKTSQPPGQGRRKSVPPRPRGWGRILVICCAWPGKWLAERKERDRDSAGKSLAPLSAFTMVIS